MIFGIIALILIGIALLVVEIVILPGTTVAGISGTVLIIAGVVMMYNGYGATQGHYTLFGSALLLGAVFVYALRSKTWKKLSLQTRIEGKVNVIDEQKIHVGDKGISVTRLAPMGMAKINDVILEVRSDEGLMDEGVSIEVVRMVDQKIIVKAINN